MSLTRLPALVALIGATLAAPGAGAQGAAPAVVVSEARTVDFADHVEALGTVRAAESVRISANVTDRIVELRFDDGDRVEAGAVLAVLDKAEEEANLRRSEAILAERRLALARLEKLRGDRLAAEEDLDQRRLAVQEAEANIAAVRARIADRVIRAPFPGVVGLRDISVGALVTPGDQITTLDDLSVVKLDFTVPAVFLDTLRPGQTITARADALGKRTFTGEVKSVDTRVDPVTRSVTVRAVLPNPDGLILPGLLMRVDLLRNERRAVVVPEAALLSRARRHSVLVVTATGADGYRVEARDVTIGGREPGLVEIVDGLAPGERVVSDGINRVSPGQEVAILAVDDGSRSLQDLLGTVAAP